MAVRKDHYRVLSIAPLSSPEQIHQVYRTLSKKWHPDLNQNQREMALEKMKELVEAYTVLSNVQSRQDYDNQPHFQMRTLEDKVKRKKAAPVAPPSLLTRLLAPFRGKGKKGAVDPRNKAVEHFGMGLSMVSYKSFLDGAKKEFKLSVGMDPNFKNAHYNLALVCYRLGEFDESVNALQRVLSLDRSDRDAEVLIQILRDHEY